MERLLTFSLYTGKSQDSQMVVPNLKTVSQTVTELLKTLTVDGDAVSGMVRNHSEKRFKKEDFGFADVYGADFDHTENFTMAQAIHHPFFKKNAAFLYPTKSHQKDKKGEICDRYRIFFILDRRVTQPSIIEFINIALINLFGHDRKCKNVNRFYFGNRTTETHIYGLENELKLSDLVSELLKNQEALELTVNQLASRNDVSNFATLLNEFSVPAVDIAVLQRLIDYSAGEKSLYTPKKRQDGKVKRSRSRLPKHRSFDKPYAENHCYLLSQKGFESSSHNELGIIISGLLKIASGYRWLKGFFKKYNRPSEKLLTNPNYYDDLIQQFRQEDYLPWRCSTFCRNFKNCKAANGNKNFSILHCQPPKTNTIVKLKDYYATTEFRSVEEIYDQMKSEVTDIVRSPDNKVHLIVAPCGSRKSTLAKEITVNLDEYVIASPRHELCVEFPGIHFKPTPASLDKVLELDRKLGLNTSATLKARAKNLYGDNCKPSDKFDIFAREKAEYLAHEAMKISFSESRKRIVTHERLVRQPSKILADIPLCMIDECIINLLLPEVTVSRGFIQTIINLRNKKFNCDTILKFLQDVLEAPSAKVKPIQLSLVDIRAFEKFLRSIAYRLTGKEENIMGLLRSEFYCSDGGVVKAIRRVTLPENKTYIIFSASPNIEAYKTLFGDRLVMHNMGKLRPVSNLQQFNRKSYSDASFQDQRGIETRKEFGRILRSHPNAEYITHKDVDDQETIRGIDCKKNSHFMATSGLNRMERRNLIVVGAKFINPTSLRLRSACLGYDHESIKDYNEAVMGKASTEYFEFPYKFLSDDPRIQRLQLHYTEDSIIQAVGRARYYSLRPDGSVGSVFLYCPYPLPEFQQMPHNVNLVQENEDDFLADAKYIA